MTSRGSAFTHANNPAVTPQVIIPLRPQVNSVSQDIGQDIMSESYGQVDGSWLVWCDGVQPVAADKPNQPTQRHCKMHGCDQVLAVVNASTACRAYLTCLNIRGSPCLPTLQGMHVLPAPPLAVTPKPLLLRPS